MSPRTERPVRAQRYRFRALDASGAVALGELWATGDEAARDQLARRRLLPTALRVEADPHHARRRPNDLELAIGLRVLASLLEARLPLDRVLGAFASVAPAGWPVSAIEEMRGRVREGGSLAATIAETFPSAPRHIVSILGAGEGSGAISEACRLAAHELELVATTSRAVRSALAYPALLALAGTVAVGVLVGIVLPRFAALLSDIGQALPWSTQAVLAAAGAFRLAALPLSALVLAGAMALRHWRGNDIDAARRIDGVLIRLPVAGPLLHSAAGARVAGTLANLLQAGVTLPVGLVLAGAASGNADIAARVADATMRVDAGERLSRAFELTGALPPALGQLLRAGEESGDLPAMLTFGARIERERLQERLTSLVRVVEPALILAFGGIIALVAASLLQAIYAVRPA